MSLQLLPPVKIGKLGGGGGIFSSLLVLALLLVLPANAQADIMLTGVTGNDTSRFGINLEDYLTSFTNDGKGNLSLYVTQDPFGRDLIQVTPSFSFSDVDNLAAITWTGTQTYEDGYIEELRGGSLSFNEGLWQLRSIAYDWNTLGEFQFFVDSSQVGSFTFGFGEFEHSQPVPEPATLAVLGLGLAGLGLMRRRK